MGIIIIKALDLWINQIKREKMKLGLVCFWPLSQLRMMEVFNNTEVAFFFQLEEKSLCEKKKIEAFLFVNLADKTHKGATMEELEASKAEVQFWAPHKTLV